MKNAELVLGQDVSVWFFELTPRCEETIKEEGFETFWAAEKAARVEATVRSLRIVATAPASARA